LPSASFERLRAYLAARAALTPAEIDFVRGLFSPCHLEKGAVLQRAGEPARLMAFVTKGCLRSYVLDEEGKVHIVSFAPEDWWLSDSAPYLDEGPSTLFIDAIEASDVLLIPPRAPDRPPHGRVAPDPAPDAVGRLPELHRRGPAIDVRVPEDGAAGP
jgi:CRP-like cAMP-binding protein